MNIKSLGVALICLLFASGAQAQAQAIRNQSPMSRGRCLCPPCA